MKDSGVDTIGPVPDHWYTKKLRHLIHPSINRHDPDLPLLSVTRELGVILRDTSSKDKNPNYVPDDLSNYKVVQVGQFAMNKMKAWQGSYGISSLLGLVSPAYFVFDLRGINGDFFHKCIRSKVYVSSFKMASDGIRVGQWDMSQARMREIAIAVPPTKSEQRAIVRFLDYMDRRINSYVRTKERLIELLDEYKQALVHHAVTGQIDFNTGQPYAEYKNSEVAWLGRVPEHWPVVSLRYIGSKFGSGVTPRGGATTYVHTGVLFLRSQNIHFDGIRLNGAAKISKEVHDSQLATHVKPGDVLLNITGASIGRVCPVPDPFEEANVNQHVCIIRPRKEKVVPEFLAMCLSAPAIQHEIQVEQTGASREGLTLHSIRGFKIALPPLESQRTILAKLSSRIEKVTIAKNGLKESISLLRDYRTRLVADVVTGKLDVREAAANLPDPDPLELVSDLNSVPNCEENSNWGECADSA